MTTLHVTGSGLNRKDLLAHFDAGLPDYNCHDC